IAVMYAGRIIELAAARRLLEMPVHPYTSALLRSIPHADAKPGMRLAAIEGQPPAPGQLPAGCAFEPRCTVRIGRCPTTRPALHPVARSHAAACHLAEPLP